MGRLLEVAGAARRVISVRLHDRYAWQQEFAQQCEGLGGVYIKFIQMLAAHQTTRGLVAAARTDMVYEHVPYESINVPVELGESLNNFKKIDPEPFAAGSYGQVYRAELLSGERVIIKILRPSVRKSLIKDLRILRVVARFASWFTRTSIFNIRPLTDEFARTTYAETDYLQEAKNGEWLRQYYDKRGTLRIPRSYPELGSRYVLVQQEVGGISLAEAIVAQQAGQRIDEFVYSQTGSNIWMQLDLLGQEALCSALYADFQMVDPHPGNVRLLSNNQVALIDFGMMSQAPKNRSAFVTMLGEMVKTYEDRFEPGAFALAMLAFLDTELHDALRVMARENFQDYQKSLESFISEYVNQQASSSLTQHYLLDRQLARLFNQVINRGNKLGIRLSEENVMLQRSMNMFLSLVRAIGELHDGQVHFALLHGIMRRVYDEALRQGFSQELTPEMSTERAYEVTANWLSMIAEKDPTLYGFIMNRSFA